MKEGDMAVIDQTALGSEQDYDPAPGVDIVMPVPEGTSSRVLDGRTLKLIGALHRRFWGRRREMLLRRAQAGRDNNGAVWRHDTAAPRLADMTGEAAASWDGRVAQLGVVVDAVDARLEDSDGVVAVRGWEDTEPGVLVDGRAVPGCVFDLAVTMNIGANAFRNEQDPFSVAIPAPADDEEAQLWLDLAELAHDRAGIERGTVRISTTMS